MMILTGASYTINNAMWFRGKFTGPELQATIKRLDEYIESEDAKKTGKVITAIHTIYLENRSSDIELFVIIDGVIPSCKEFSYIQTLSLSDCIMTKYNGSLHLLPDVYRELCHKAREIGLTAKQPFYNVSNGEIIGSWINYEIEVDIYATLEYKCSRK